MAVFRVPAAELRAAQRCRASVAFARQAAMYLAHVGYGLSPTSVGRMFARDRTTVAYGCQSIEDRRDDPRVDRVLTLLETALEAWSDADAAMEALRP